MNFGSQSLEGVSLGGVDVKSIHLGTQLVWEFVEEENWQLIMFSDKFMVGLAGGGISPSINANDNIVFVSTSGNENWMTFWYDPGISWTNIKNNFSLSDIYKVTFTMRSPNSTVPPTLYLGRGDVYRPLTGTLSNQFSEISYEGPWVVSGTPQPHFGFANAIGTYEVQDWKIEKKQ